jgi:flavin-dependent dehydrogenase
MYDVAIIGAGLAGLQCARVLSREGAKVLLVDRKGSPDEFIHTTGIFVRKTFEDFAFPQSLLGPAISRVTLYSPYGKKLELESAQDEFRVGRMAEVYRHLLHAGEMNGVTFSPHTKFIDAEVDRGGNLLLLESKRRWSVRARFIIGADGARSRVAEALQLDRNSAWIVGTEQVFRGVTFGTPQFHCFLDPKIAPGYLGWVVDDGEEVHIGTGGYASQFHAASALAALRERVARELGLKLEGACEHRGGLIPVNGVLTRIANRRGLLVGDAAGAVSPLTAGGIDAALRLSQHACEVITAALSSHDPRALDRYRGDAYRARFISRLWMRKAMDALANRPLAELALRTLALPPFRPFAEKVFFGRGSFPDLRETGAEAYVR